MELFKNLNKQQIEAVQHLDGPCLVMAGAGSGKTKVLTTRIVNLIENGVRDSEILAITFTNKAAKEMRDRVFNIYGDVRSFIGTFHSFGLKVIRENTTECDLKANFTILDSDDCLSIIKKILKNNNLDPKKYSPYAIRSKISSFKNEMLSATEMDRCLNTDFDSICKDIYYKYQKILRESNVMDFDDLLVKPVELFMNRPDILERYQEHYKYLLVDEYQDTNPVQYKLCHILSMKYKNIFVVGDMNQSIYGFRQADYKNIMYFERDYKDCKVIKLEENYRSTNNILNAANSVIKNNKERKDLNLWSEKGDGLKIKYVRCYDERHEAKMVASEINQLIEEGIDKNEIAVLYRTNGQSRILEEAMLSHSIPYKVVGSYYFYNRKEIKDLIAYLRLIYNNDDSVSLRRIINVPKRGIGDKAVFDLEHYAEEAGISMFQALTSKKELEFKKLIEDLSELANKSSLTELIEAILEKTGMRKEYTQDGSLEGELRIENLEEFKSITATFESREGSVDLGDFLEEVSLVADMSEHKDVTDAVTLMTIHSAKGLEFQVVFLVGMEDGIFPHSNSFLEENGIEEERRLCYVGITRAKELLYLTNAKRRMLYGKENANMPSRFISEIDPSYIDKSAVADNDIFEKKIETKQVYIEGGGDDINKGDTIEHDTLGVGVVLSVDGSIIEVAFKTGVKKLMKNHKSIRKV